MGFSDHAPFKYPDGYEAPYRIPMREVEDYFAEGAALREKYRDKIDIKVGFEMEYYAPYFDRMLREAIEYGAEYLILGQHHIGNGYPVTRSSYYGTDRAEDLKTYVESVISAMKTGVFTYVAHPDVIKYNSDLELYREQMRKICIASVELDIPLELNFLGIREGRIYPTEAFWQIAGEVGSPVTFGLDAHDVMSAYDADSLATAEEMVKKYKLNYIGMPKLTSLR